MVDAIVMRKMINYRIEDEIAGDCEWETFTVGSICKEDATKVIITEEIDGDLDFHWAHLCDTHIKLWDDDQRREEVLDIGK